MSADPWGVASTAPATQQTTTDPWGVARVQHTGEGPAARQTGTILQRLKNVGGDVAVLADMVLSAPAFAISTGAQLTGTVRAMAEGSKTPFEQGRAVGQAVLEMPGIRAGVNPLQKIIQDFANLDPYEGSGVAKGMEKLMGGVEAAGKWVEERTGGRVPRDSVPMFLDTFLTSLTGVAGGKRKSIDPVIAKSMREAAERMRQTAELELKAQETVRAEQAVRRPVQAEINTMLGVKTPQQRAAEARKRREDVRAAFKQPAEGSDYVDIDESIFKAEERAALPEPGDLPVERRIGGTAYEVGSAARPERIGQAEILRVLQKPGFERTAEDLLLLRRAKAEGGNVSPEVPLLLSAAGIGAAIGAELDDDALRGAVLGGATAGAGVLPFLGRGPSVPRLRGEAGAVKGPGGAWAPTAVERLSSPLKDTLASAQDVLNWQRAEAKRIGITADTWTPDEYYKAGGKDFPADVQADRMVRNYLNKYAGTDRDPLKDVEVPFGEGTKRWEELTDSIIQNRKVQGPRGEETEWMASPFPQKRDPVFPQPTRQAEMSAVQSYLSHVGDYLRQNVSPEKLSQYDLVRAVRETAANDARVAKQMEKAAADVTAQLPVYKQYPDGFRWVELKLPEKLTPEQAKSVKKATRKELKQLLEDAGEYDPPAKGEVAYIALNAEGKPLRNTYTDEIASGPTPEQAYLAGRLAEEGNQMGHCVGGYCEGVAAGESRIYSLRDAKGRSHVTVEVEPVGYEPYANVSQIKGKQNRAPKAEYLPYVQDFVKSGKWGEVGDLENTGLTRAYDVLLPDGRRADELAQGKSFLTEEEIRNLKGEAVLNLHRQRGAIDPQLTIGLGALGLGGLIGAQLGDDPIEGGILGALAGAALGFTASGKQRLREAAETLDDIGGPIRTRLQNISPQVALQLVNTERKILTDAGDRLLRTVPFSKALERLPDNLRNKFEAAALTGDGAAVSALIKGNPEMVAAVREVRTVLNDLGKELQGRGRFRSMADDYFPRMVKDYQGLMAALGKDVEGPLSKKLAEAEAASMKSRGLPLSEVERSVLVNQEIFNNREMRGRLLSNFKARTIPEVTEQLLEFYYPLRESLFRYVVDATDDLETAKFFGRDEVLMKKEGGQTVTNVPVSAGNLTGRLLKEGKLKPDDEKLLQDLLVSRFLKSRKPPNWWVQQMRSGSHLTLLGNPASAAVQLGDPMMAFYNTGLKAALTGVARTLSGTAKITARDFHLSDHIAQEFFDSSSGGLAKGKLSQAGMIAGGAAIGGMLAEEDTLSGILGGAAAGWVAAVGTANAVNRAFKTVGFTAIDNFGKNVHLNAALTKYQNLARNPKGIARISEKYQEAFGDEFPNLVRDLRERRLTENVRLLAFNELSDMQPITKSEMSKMWLESPNVGRLALTLKTFTQKMIDIARRDGYNEIKKGNRARGLRNLTALAFTLGVSGASADAVRDFILGREVDFTAGDILENALKTVGFSEYVRDKAGTDPVAAVGGIFLPPYQVMDDILSRDPKAAQYIPVIGKLYYSWELGGREDDELRRAKEAQKRGEDFDLSEAARERRREKREAERQKRAEETE